MNVSVVASYHEDMQKFPYVNFGNMHADKVWKTLYKAVEDNRDLFIFTVTGNELNFFGHMIANKRMKPDQFTIAVYDEQRQKSDKEIYYNSKGYLENWPYGFFEPDCWSE